MSFPRSSFPLIRPGTTVKQTNQWINAKLMGKKIVSLILSLKFKNNKYKSYFDLPPRSREGSWALTVLLSGSRPISASISWNRPEKMFLMIFIICHRQMCGAKKKTKQKTQKNQKQTKNKRWHGYLLRLRLRLRLLGDLQCRGGGRSYKEN